MVFDRLFGFFRTAPSIPTLYPGVDPLALEQFLSDEDYARIGGLRFWDFFGLIGIISFNSGYNLHAT